MQHESRLLAYEWKGAVQLAQMLTQMHDYKVQYEAVRLPNVRIYEVRKVA